MRVFKKVILPFILFFVCGNLAGQVANTGINFQAVARDNYANPAKDRNIYVEASIIQQTGTGVVVLKELHKTTTDGAGVFSISVGNGTRIGGTVNGLNNIEWAKGPYFLGLKIAIQPISPVQNWDYTREWIDLGATQFGTVPYALYSGSSSTIEGKLNISDTANMLAPYKQLLSSVNTNSTSIPANLTAILDGKLNISDSTIKYVTPAQLNAKTFDSANIYNQLGLKVNSSSFTTSLASKEDIVNKSLNLLIDANSDIKYPSVRAVKNYVDAQVTSATTIVDASITDAKIATVSGSKITGNITGNAVNVTGIVGIANGGTGASNAAAARTNLGLAIGTNVQAPLTFNTPIVSNGNTISLNKATSSVDGYLSATDFTSFNNKIDATQKAANNGVATLGNDGKIPSNQIPAISFQSANVVSSQAQMLALGSAVVGSIAIRTDLNKNFVLSATPASTLGNWLELQTPTSVTSVNGNAGPSVVLTTNDVSEGANNKYFTDARARASLSATAPLSYNSVTGTLSMTAASASTNGYLTAGDYAVFNNKQNTLTAAVDYLTPTGSAATLTNFPTLNQNTTGNAATATKLAASKNINGVAFDGSANITIAADANTLTGTTLAGNVLNSSLTSVGTITTGVWSGTTIAITKGGTGATTATAALTNLGAEPTANKSTATDLGSTNPSDILFPSQKAVKTYVDMQSANAGVADGSITNAKLNGGITFDKLAGNIPASKLVGTDITTVGTITSGVWSGTTIDIAHGGTGATTAAGARTNLGLVIGTNVMAANAVTTLTGDVTGAGNGSIATTVNSVGGVSSSTISGFDTRITTSANNIASNTSSITALTSSVATNTASITQNIADINLKAPIASPNLTGTPTAPTATAGTNTTQLATTAFVNAAVSNYTPTTTLNLAGGVAGNIPYQTAPGATGFIPNGTANQFLTATGSGTYTWTSASSLSGVPYTGATGAVNLGAYDLTVNGLTVGTGTNGGTLSNTALGIKALNSNTTGNSNTAIGTLALQLNTTNSNNTAVGFSALTNNTTNGNNTAVGSNALFNTSGNNNTAIGFNSGYNTSTSSNYNSLVGVSAGSKLKGSYNIGLGANALYMNNGVAGADNNIAIGAFTLFNASKPVSNVVIGHYSGYNLSYGAYNTLLGQKSGLDVTSGYHNTLIGDSTGLGITTGSLNTILGARVSGLSPSLTGNIILADGAGNIRAQHDGLSWSLGVIGSGTWSSTVIGSNYGGAGSVNGLLKANGSGVVSAAVAGTDYMAANATTTLTGDVTGSGNGSFATTVNSVGGVSSATISTLPTSIAANTSSITSLTNAVAANTISITSNTNSIALLTTSVNTLNGNVTSTSNNYFTSIPNLAEVGTITSGVWSGTAIDIAHGGTGATTAADARTNLGLVIGTNVLAPNAAITAATKTKITYDANGLVTSGTDATTADIAPSTNRNYVTDTQAGVISNTSGTNTGDETASTIKTKLGITTLSGTNTGDQTITLTGDITGTGTGTFTTTLANTGVAANTYGSATLVPILTVDTKGRITSASTTAINGGVNTVTAIAGTANAYGATISGTALTLTPADASNGGIVTTDIQTFAGAKTFSNTTTFNTDITVNGIPMGNGKKNLTGNTIIGKNAFNASTATGTHNTVIGNNALQYNTIGLYNTVVGSNAMASTTSTGYSNQVYGYAALYNNTSGYGNSVFGDSSMYFFSTGYNNVSMGNKALAGQVLQSASGYENVAIGYATMNSIYAGNSNIGIGAYALGKIDNGKNNIAIGTGAGQWVANATNTTPATGLNNNIFIGHDSRPSGSSDQNEIVIGNSIGALTSPFTGAGQIGLGSNSTLIGNTLTQKAQIYGVLTTIPSAAATTASGNSSIIEAQGTTNAANAGGNVTIKAGSNSSTGTAGNVILTPGTSSNAANNGIVQVNGQIKITGTIEIDGGSPGAGKVLTSDANGLASWATSASSGVSTLTYTTATSYANGGTISGSTLTLAAADATNPGLISTGSQTIAGAKTFNTDLTVNGITVGKGLGSVSTNTAVGSTALATISTGANNTAIGYSALNANSTGNQNTAVGNEALKVNTASSNTAVGMSVLKANLDGAVNSGFGNLALFSNTSGGNNSAFGGMALRNNLTGSDNTAIGQSAGQNAKGAQNVYLGSYAGFKNTTVSNNIMVGYNAGAFYGSGSLTNNNLTGDGNVLIGTDVRPLADGQTNQIVIAGYTGSGDGMIGNGSNSTTIGNASTATAKIYGALTLPSTTASTSTTTGALTVAGGVGIASNTYIGGTLSIAGGNPGEGKFLTSDANGLAAWTSVVTGVSTLTYSALSYANGGTISGTTLTLAAANVNNPGLMSTASQAFTGLKTFNDGAVVSYINTNNANANIAFGYQGASAYQNGTGSKNIAIGSNAMGNWVAGKTGNSNVAIGDQALFGNTTGTGNIALGYQTLYNNTGNENIAIGGSALNANTSGYYNVALGGTALRLNTTGRWNVALGYGSLENNNAEQNTAVGLQALNKNTTGQNDALGYGALFNNTTGDKNTAIGNQALGNNTTANGNVAVGNAALNRSTTSPSNVAIGQGAGAQITTDASNLGGSIFIGKNAGTNQSDGTANSTGYNNIFIGREVMPLNNGDNNEIVIGNYINPAGVGSGSIGLGSNSTSIGNVNTTKAIIYASSSLSNLSATASSGNGGDFTLKAQDAFATGNNNGGNIVLTPGAGANSGTTGKVTANGIFTATSIQNTPIGTVTASSGKFTTINGSGVISVLPSVAASNTDGSSSTIAAQGAGSGTQLGGRLNLWAGDGTGGSNGGDVYIQPGSSSTAGNIGSLLVNTTNKSLISSYSPAGLSILVPAGHDGFTLKSEADGNNVMNLWQIGTNNTNMITFHKGVTAQGAASVVGTINVTTTATTYNTTSDYRLKTDFKDFSGVDLLRKIKVYDYQWKVDSSRSFGVKAHELQSVIPYAVSGKKDAVNANGSINPQTVDYSKLVPVLIKAVQEQDTKLKDINTENKQLKELIEMQKKQLEMQNKRLQAIEEALIKLNTNK